MTTATTPKRFTFEPILYTTTNANNNTTTNSPSNNTTNTINNTNNINNTTTTTTTSMDIQIESGFGGGVLGRSKPRTRPSASQLEELKALYAQNRHPSRSAREQLGGRIGMWVTLSSFVSLPPPSLSFRSFSALLSGYGHGLPTGRWHCNITVNCKTALRLTPLTLYLPPPMPERNRAPKTDTQPSLIADWKYY